ncbi:MAG: dethiobiotin synthase [Solirubrobacteraceae bacterium]
MSAHGLLVSATDTGVGKTVVAAALCAALSSRGQRVAAFKPAVTGLLEPDPRGAPPDHELLALATGQAADEVAPERFGPAVSPHLAAELAGRTIDVEQLLRRARELGARADVTVVEGVGGLLVPLAPGWDILGFARELGFGILIAARPGLGSINHTLLTLAAARCGGLHVHAVVLTPWPQLPDAVEQSNLRTIAQLGRVPVLTLPWLRSLDRGALAAAGEALLEALPWEACDSVPAAPN